MIGYLPNLLIIGAAKAGTSSLHAYLAEHPQVAMSKQKELQLFNRPDDWRERLDWYRSNFLVRAPVRGESSPAYSMDPIFGDVPARVAEVIPNASIIYMVRDPIVRALGQFVEWTFVRVEDRPFEEAFADWAEPSNAYVMASRYFHQIDCYRQHFPDERILVLDQRDLLERRRDTLRAVFRFLGVDEDFWTPAFDRVHNVGAQKLRVNDFGWWLASRGLYLPIVGAARALPGRAATMALRPLGTEIPRPVPDPELLDGLRQVLREDADRLREYTGRRFEHWAV